ncbi:hypothetical protein OUZ56_000883 [Daphnia magna]|uniref:Uncharacterized protein n=1 Tax=Daphnia magna TaxID=35525 RepID=A0ABR0A122_9CRUS|nr:hypothetical protein OUZ56_000883 [Daphnia magna]
MAFAGSSGLEKLPEKEDKTKEECLFSFYGAGDPSRIFPQQNALLRVYMVVVGYAAPAVKCFTILTQMAD